MSQPQQPKWWIGLLPGGLMLFQMAIFFSFGIDKFMQKDWPWMAVLTAQFLVCFALLYRFTIRAVGGLDKKGQRFQWVVWGWIALWLTVYLLLPRLDVPPRLADFKNIEAYERYSDAWSDRLFTTSIALMALMFGGLVGMVLSYRIRFMKDDRPTSGQPVTPALESL